MTLLRRRSHNTLLLFTLIWLTSGCSETPETTSQSSTQAATATEAPPKPAPRFALQKLDHPKDTLVANPTRLSNRVALFGDIHVHTTYSFDAFAFGTLATPHDAYRYALGEAIKHPAGFDMQLREPLDFYAVTDHAMFLGAVPAAADTSTEFSKLAQNVDLHNLNADENMNLDSLAARSKAFSTFLGDTLAGIVDGKVSVDMINDISRDAWDDTVAAAEKFNQPGKFTTFVAYEYTSSTDDRGNLHRNVIFKGSDNLPAVPFSRFHSQNPEGLWDWLDDLRSQGIEALAIPHNANGSNGQMFKMVDWAGDPMDEEYAAQRLRNEPLVEISQIKGTSETHPTLSTRDEWADFEIMPYRIATSLPSEPKGSYVRDALLSGLSMESQGAGNPYKFGFVGSSDTHLGATSEDESNFFAKVGLLDSTSFLRGSVPLKGDEVETVQQAGRQIEEIDGEQYLSTYYQTWGTSGLAGVWADENSRDAIYEAFRRKETFATSGPRIKVRFFGSEKYSPAILESKAMVEQAYASGVPMGSNLLITDGTPGFLVIAERDASSAPLQRLQIIKGWIENGEPKEMVYDVACSDGNAVDKSTHRCPDNGAKVNLENCAYTANRGAAQLRAFWQDPDYSPDEEAFYYARVLENPTCRWSTWDAIRAGVKPKSNLQATVQERAWSSPIWTERNS